MPSTATASLDLLEREITARYGCTGIATKKEIVRAVVGDKALVIPVTRFELIGHESAEYCYAWYATKKNGGEKIMTVLEVAPIFSAEDAVWARLNYDEAS